MVVKDQEVVARSEIKVVFKDLIFGFLNTYISITTVQNAFE